MKKVYLAHPISTTGEFNDSIRVAERINGTYQTNEVIVDGELAGTVIKPKFVVYAPALNKDINDKSNDPTPQIIYEQDVDRLLASDVVVINYTGGDADGTILELGMLSGMYESVKEEGVLPKVLVYSSNQRALRPQLHNGIASGKLNHMVLGAIDKHFIWCDDEDEMIQELFEL